MMQSVPFKVDEFEGFLETEGMLRIEEDALVMEFRKKEGIFGVPVSGLKEIRIPISELNAVTFKKKMVGSKLIVKGHKMSTFADLPGSQHAEVVLSIARKDRETAEDLQANLAVMISEAKLKQLD
ncbi:MAG: hypothetical protein ACE5I1_11645 [bacterium]